MYRRTTFFQMRPRSYQDDVDAHTLRVAAAGGQGADPAALLSYYTLRGQNLLQPRACFMLDAGYRLDANGLVEYLFDPEGADLEQPDPAQRASLGSTASGRPALLFSGSQSYQAVDVTPYQLGTGDLVHYTQLRVDVVTDFTLYNLSGAYYATHYAGPGVTVVVLNPPEKFYDQYATGGGVASTPSQASYLGSFVLRGNQRNRVFLTETYGSELDPIPSQAGNPATPASTSYTTGSGFTGLLTTLLNLPASPGSIADRAVWQWLRSRA